MITDEDARALVASMRGLAKTNEAEATQSRSEEQRAWLNGRANAYYLAADWLEELIPGEETDNE